MFKPSQIEEVIEKSVQDKWEYPKTFAALQAAGVEFYEVDVATHRTIYQGYGQKIDKMVGNSKKCLPIASIYDENQLIETIRRNQAQQITYEEFLAGIAAAGVVKYIVNMRERTVNYWDQYQERHIEPVPNFD